LKIAQKRVLLKLSEHPFVCQEKKMSSSSSSSSSSAVASSSSSRFSNTEELPIDLHRHTILERIRHERVVIIHGETGCGKSSRLPQFLLEDALERGEVAFHCISCQFSFIFIKLLGVAELQNDDFSASQNRRQ
jgi:HrpA-like RNA helicase